MTTQPANDTTLSADTERRARIDAWEQSEHRAEIEAAVRATVKATA